MKKLAVCLSVLAGMGCGDAGPEGPEVIRTSSPTISGLKHADGTYDLIVGPAAEEALLAGKMPTSWWKLGNVTQQRVDQAKTKATQVATFSLEDPANGDMVIEFSGMPPLQLRAGDPCVSGVVQVAIDPKSGSPLPVFDVHHWTRYPGGPTGKDMYTTGVWPDEPWPTLQYNGGTPSPNCK